MIRNLFDQSDFNRLSELGVLAEGELAENLRVSIHWDGPTRRWTVSVDDLTGYSGCETVEGGGRTLAEAIVNLS